jgi:hypothetical protein
MKISSLLDPGVVLLATHGVVEHQERLVICRPGKERWHNLQVIIAPWLRWKPLGGRPLAADCLANVMPGPHERCPSLMDCSKLTAISPMMVRGDAVETTAATFTLSSSISWTFLSRSWLLWVCSPVILRSFMVMSAETTVTGQENRFLHMQIQ